MMPASPSHPAARACGAVLAFALLGSGLAAAQTPPSYIQNNIGLQGFLDGEGIRLRSAEERGIRLGQIVLWPSFFLEGRWDSNLFQEEEEAAPSSCPRDSTRAGPRAHQPQPHDVQLRVRHRGPESALAGYLEDARRLVAAVGAGAAATRECTDVDRTADFEALRWFPLPTEVAAELAGAPAPSRPRPSFKR